MRILPVLVFAAAVGTAAGAVSDSRFGVGGQLLVSRAQLEPGAVAEWAFGDELMGTRMAVRPELFVNQDGDIGGGGSFLWRLPIDAIPRGQSLWVGPRVVHHNADDWGIAGDALAIYNIAIPEHEHHNIEIIGLLGFIRQEQNGDQDSELKVDAGIGAAYLYRF